MYARSLVHTYYTEKLLIWSLPISGSPMRTLHRLCRLPNKRFGLNKHALNRDRGSTGATGTRINLPTGVWHPSWDQLRCPWDQLRCPEIQALQKLSKKSVTPFLKSYSFSEKLETPAWVLSKIVPVKILQNKENKGKVFK